MGVAASQTVEDGAPRDVPFTTLHHEGESQEYIRVEMSVRVQWWLVDSSPRARLVIRASKESEQVTAALESLRTE